MKKSEALAKLIEHFVHFLKKHEALNKIVVEYEPYLKKSPQEQLEGIQANLLPYEFMIDDALELMLQSKGINVQNIDKEVMLKIKQYVKAIIEFSR